MSSDTKLVKIVFDKTLVLKGITRHKRMTQLGRYLYFSAGECMAIEEEGNTLSINIFQSKKEMDAHYENREQSTTKRA
jgi:hypothetical protein